jgi:hypothetical protein
MNAIAWTAERILDACAPTIDDKLDRLLSTRGHVSTRLLIEQYSIPPDSAKMAVQRFSKRRGLAQIGKERAGQRWCYLWGIR